MKIGDRVTHEYLGNGTIRKAHGVHLVNMVLVEFDNNPPVRYNMGENPCAVWRDELKLIQEVPPCEYCLNLYSKKMGDEVYSANVCYEPDCQELFKKKYIEAFDEYIYTSKDEASRDNLWK